MSWKIIIFFFLESDTALSITVPDKRLLFEISASQAQAICKELKRAKDSKLFKISNDFY